MKKIRSWLLCGWLALASSQTARAEFNFYLPPSAIGFKFGAPAIPGLKNVRASTGYATNTGYGLSRTQGMHERAAYYEGDWVRRPDPLAATYVVSGPQVAWCDDRLFEFRADVSNGEYLVWLGAGKSIHHESLGRRYFLRLNDQTLCDELPSAKVFNSDRYAHRFIWDQFSRRPNAVWNQYIDKVYPSCTRRINVTNGQIVVTSAGHFLSGLIAVPARDEGDFNEMVRDIRRQRIREFELNHAPVDQRRPVRLEGDGDVLVYYPGVLGASENIAPWTNPDPANRKRNRIKAAGARNERVILRVVVVPFVDIGVSTLELADLKGPGTIAARDFKAYNHAWIMVGADPQFGRKITGGWYDFPWRVPNYIVDDRLLPARTLGEQLMPNGVAPLRFLAGPLTLDMEEAMPYCFWLILRVPGDAPAGKYEGAFTFRPGKGPPIPIPVEFEVYPFALDPAVPGSFGMYATGHDMPPFVTGAARRQLLTERFERMREDLNFTAAEVDAQLGIAWLDRPNTNAFITLDTDMYQAARDAGLARGPGQELLLANVYAGLGRSLGGFLGKGIGNPEFNALFTDAMRRYKAKIDEIGVPVAVNIVDEPRENPQGWNLNLANTLAFAKLCRDAQISPIAVNPMGDSSGSRDYTVLADACDIISTHAWPQSGRLIAATRAKQKRLWLFNAGLDRYTWGFYMWAIGGSGRWEWHLCWREPYSWDPLAPGIEWHNPWMTPRSHEGAAHSDRAPHLDPRFKGGIVFDQAMYIVGEGVTDFQYLCALTEALKKKYRGNKADTAKQADEFMTELRKAIPAYPSIQGLGHGANGAVVGMRSNDWASAHMQDWREKIAGYLKELNK